MGIAAGVTGMAILTGGCGSGEQETQVTHPTSEASPPTPSTRLSIVGRLDCRKDGRPQELWYLSGRESDPFSQIYSTVGIVALKNAGAVLKTYLIPFRPMVRANGQVGVRFSASGNSVVEVPKGEQKRELSEKTIGLSILLAPGDSKDPKVAAEVKKLRKEKGIDENPRMVMHIGCTAVGAAVPRTPIQA